MTVAELRRFRAYRNMILAHGMTELFLPCSRGGYHGLWIEMKAIGGHVSREQEQWRNDLLGQGYMCAVCYGADAAIETIEKYMRLKNEGTK